MSGDADLIERHLRLLVERLPADLVLPVVSIRSNIVRLQSAASAESHHHASSSAARLAASHHLFVGAGAISRARLRELKNAGRRGGAADVSALVGFWLDLDIRHSSHASAELPPTLDDADLILAELPTASLVWRTGGGLQAWWLFAEPVDCVGTEQHRVQRASKRWHQHAQQVARQLGGWHVDDTSDLARLLRLGGTLNLKHIAPPTVVLHDAHWSQGQRYHVNDLVAFVDQRLPAEQVPRPAPARPAPALDGVRPASSKGSNVLGVVDRLDWSRIWPNGWRRVADVVVDGVVCERWLRPGSSSSASVTCWPEGGCQVHSSAVPGLPPGPYSRASVLAWATGLRSVQDLVDELRRRQRRAW